MSKDYMLPVALLLASLLSLHGIHWGRYETWHPDQMGFKNMIIEGELELHPTSFYKPPFHTYFSYALSFIPWKITSKILDVSGKNRQYVKLVLCRLITVLMFLASIILIYRITADFFGVAPAGIIALVFATSSGFIANAHFMTADIPVMLWMLVAFYFAKNILTRGRWCDYILAGLFTGIAGATKYNGIGVGIAIAVAHMVAADNKSLKKLFFDKKIILGLSMVIVGFVAGNPYAVLDYKGFIGDFMYNNLVAPVYSGDTGGHGYGKFFLRYPELIGWPTFIVFSLAIVSGFILIIRKKCLSLEIQGTVLLFAVFILYYLVIGSFSRLPSRFVLPAIPFWLMLSGPFWQYHRERRLLLRAMLVLVVGYNLISGYYVGLRFADDPRMLSQQWVKDNIQTGSAVEITGYSPRWSKTPGVMLDEERMPFINGLGRLLGPVLKDSQWAGKLEEDIQWERDNISWYTREQLVRRSPDYLAINSLYYKRFVDDGRIGDLYPGMRKYFRDLLGERYPYRIVFDRETITPPGWLYPRELEFVDNRQIIMKRVVD